MSNSQLLRSSLRQRTFSLFLTTAIIMAPALARGSEMPAQLQQQTASVFVAEKKRIAFLKVSAEPVDRLELARLLARGVLKNDHNPLRSPDPETAIAVYRSLLIDGEVAARPIVAKELITLLTRFGGRGSLAEVDDLRAKYVLSDKLIEKSGRLQANEDGQTAGEDEVDALKEKMAAGSIEAGFRLLDLLSAQQSPETDVVRSQVLFLANLAAADSANDAFRFANLYVTSLDGRSHPKQALQLIELAAENGSEAAVSLIDDNRELLLRAVGADALRQLLWQMIKEGSTRAAEIVALDLLEKNNFGFDEQDSRWAIDALTEIGSARADYLNAKLYYQGIYAKKDVSRAIAAMDRMLAATNASRSDLEVTANRLTRLGLSAELTAQYVLPLYMQLLRDGKTTAMSQIARIVMAAQKSGAYASPSALPIKVEVIIAGLDEAYADGDRNAAMVKADILREGLLIAPDLVQSRKIYDELLADNRDDSTFAIRVEERIAKTIRKNVDVTGDYGSYLDMLASLADRKNLWAMKEYGSLLIGGAPQLERDEKKGFELLVQAFSEGYLSAGRSAAAFAVKTGDSKLLARVSHAYSSLDQRQMAPEDRIAIAEVDLKLNIYKKAIELLDSPDVQMIPRGRFLLAEARYLDNSATTVETASEMRAMISNYAGDVAQLVSFIATFADLRDLPASEAEPVLVRLAAAADSGDRRAIELALKLRQKWPESNALGFRRVVAWSSELAHLGRGQSLTRLALNADDNKIPKEDFVALIDAVEASLPFLPTNGNLRMFVSRQYITGVYRKRDFRKADELDHEAALLGNSEALNAIAVNYFYGQGVQIDRQRSDQLFRKLAFLGSNRSTIALARSYSKGPSSRVYESRAFAYYTKAALNGSLIAMTELGRSYLAGAGVAKDEAKGVEWLVKASERNNIDAMTQLYFHYFIQNPTIDNPQAEKWLDRLVQENVPEMIVRKAVLLYSRDPVANRDKVFALLDQAEAFGSQFARRLKNVYIQKERGD